MLLAPKNITKTLPIKKLEFYSNNKNNFFSTESSDNKNFK
jgi:hypothetical protein